MTEELPHTDPSNVDPGKVGEFLSDAVRNRTETPTPDARCCERGHKVIHFARLSHRTQDEAQESQRISEPE